MPTLFPPGLCSTKGQWAARTPPMATCRRHPSRRETRWTSRCNNRQRSASEIPTAAWTYKVLVADIVVNSGDDDREILGDDVRYLHDVAHPRLLANYSLH